MSVMVTLGVTWNGMTRPYFSVKGERFNGYTNQAYLLPFYKKEGDLIFGNKNWGFQQDEASSHTERNVQQWCRKNFKLFHSERKMATELAEAQSDGLFHME